MLQLAAGCLGNTDQHGCCDYCNPALEADGSGGSRHSLRIRSISVLGEEVEPIAPLTTLFFGNNSFGTSSWSPTGSHKSEEWIELEEDASRWGSKDSQHAGSSAGLAPVAVAQANAARPAAEEEDEQDLPLGGGVAENVRINSVPQSLARERADSREDIMSQIEGAMPEAEHVVKATEKLLRARPFRSTKPPPRHKVRDNAYWLRECVLGLDMLDPHTPMVVVHWSALKRLGRFPKNPDDAEYLEKAADAIDKYGVSSTSALVFCMVSHSWQHPVQHAESSKMARILAHYGEAAKTKNVDMYFWLEPAAFKQDDVRDMLVGAGKLPGIISCCTEFLILWSEDYEQQAWTRLERLLGYALSPCLNFQIIDQRYGQLAALEPLLQSGVVSTSSSRSATLRLKVVDPLEGQLTSEIHRRLIDKLIETGRGFAPIARNGTSAKRAVYDKSRVDIVRASGMVPP